MIKNHNYYLELAFQLAENNLGKTKLNPSVGSVVVKDNIIISSGITSLNGQPHSEFHALNSVSNCAGATLYTTLEPCTHYGKTPPCTNIIIKKKIKNVFYAFEDPDKRTYKKAKKVLKISGIRTKLIRLKKFSKFYKSYFVNKKNEIPFVSAKIAISRDFLTINKEEKWITNERSRAIVHLLRSKHDSILSTSKSINFDNSKLNCRIEGLNHLKPDLFIVDLDLKLKKKLLLNKFLFKRKIFLITKKKNMRKSLIYKKLGYRILFINSLKNEYDFNILYKKIYKLGYGRLLIETGLTFLNSIIKYKKINELYIFQNNKKLGKKGKNNASNKYLKKNLFKLITININGDKLFKKEF